MFKLAQQNEVLWPVTVQVPQDGGTTKAVEISVRYRLLTKTDARDMKAMDDAASEQALLSHITGWEGVADMAGNPVPFTPDNLAALVEHDYVARAIVLGLYQASKGAPAKN